MLHPITPNLTAKSHSQQSSKSGLSSYNTGSYRSPATPGSGQVGDQVSTHITMGMYNISCVQAVRAGQESTPLKRIMGKHHPLRMGKWVKKRKMRGVDGWQHNETINKGDDVFIIGHAPQNWRKHICETSVCNCCRKQSQPGAAGPVECDKCLCAVHLWCNRPPLEECPDVSAQCSQAAL